MKLPGRYLQSVNKHLPECRQGDSIARYQPQQYVTGPVSSMPWPVLRMVVPSAIIIYAIGAALIVFVLPNQTSAIEVTFRAAGNLIRCLHRLSVDGHQILSQLIAGWHAINASMDWVS